jgi:hypothetical protein
MKDRKIKLTTLMLRTLTLASDLILVSPATAAEILEVGEKYIFELVNQGHLQRVRIVDSRDREIGVGISRESVDRYAARERPPRWRKKQLDLLSTST